MSEKIVVTGIGIISAIGDNTEENYQRLKAEKSGIGDIEFLQTIHRGKIPVGEIKHSDEELREMAEGPSDILFTRTELLGIIAAKEAIRDAGLDVENDERTGFISASSVGGMSSTELRYLKYLHETGPADYLPLINQHGCGECTDRIVDIIGIKGYHTTISTACSSSANSIMHGAELIKNGILDRVVVGGVDALTKFTVNGFNTLMILDKEPCRPFDAERRGLNLGEGAGYIVLESEGLARKSGKKIYCALSGYGNSNDAFHQTASSPEGEGAYLAMKKAFDVSGLNPGQIDYVNAHGTGTEINDLSEGNALLKLFNGKIPPFSSTKCYTGHALGASGGIEAAYSVLSIDRKGIFPNLRWKTKMPEINAIPVQQMHGSSPVNHVLSNSFGFGGNTSSLIFSRN